jgi:hypothetical protein
MHSAPWESLPKPYEVSFIGPPMDRRTRGALSAAAITPLADRHNSLAAIRAGASERHQFVVLVRASNADRAIEQIRTAVRMGGACAGFRALLSAD